MPAAKKLLAFDLGAESGRGILGLFDGQRLRLEVVHRFPNGPVRRSTRCTGTCCACTGRCLTRCEMCGGARGRRSARRRYLGRRFRACWVGTARCWATPAITATRTPRRSGAAFRAGARAEIFRQTGIQFMRFNTLFQLLALQRRPLAAAGRGGDAAVHAGLFHYFFTGIKVNELTDASTSQMLDPTARGWAYGLVKAFGLPGKILGTLVPPGQVLGPLRPSVAAETGLTPVPVIAPASHDTASAVAAVPAESGSWAYISSGTWSLMGVELPAPLVNETALRYNFTNEGGSAARSGS